MTITPVPEGVTLRPAVLPADRPCLEAMMASLQEYERTLIGDRLPGPEMAATHLAALLGAVASKDGRIFLADVGASTSVGFAIGWVEESFGRYIVQDKARYGYISDLFVEEAWRGRGIGRALINAMEAQFQLLGLSRIAIGSLMANTNTRRRYEAAGYQPYSVEFIRDLDI